MGSSLVVHLQRLNGWRLWLAFSLATVVCALLIVSLMDLALMGKITLDYLLTGLVAAGIIAPASLFLMGRILRDLAERQQQELSRTAANVEARLRVALDSSDEGILMVAADGRVLSANRRFFELWRVPPELATAGQDGPLLAHVLDQLIDPEGFLVGVQRLYGSSAQANDILQFKDGRIFERYTRALDLDAEPGRIWCFRDVSVHAQTREALAEREEQFQAIVNQAGEGIDLIDAETLRFVEVNEAACRMLGYRRNELVDQPVAMIQASLDEAALREAVDKVVREGEGKFEIQHRCKDGRVIDVFSSSRAIRLRGRTCLVGVWHDIGDRKDAEKALKESRTLLQTIIDSVPMRVFWKDQHLRYLGCNPAFAHDAGKSTPRELLGQDDHQLAWAEQAALYQADDRAVMASGIAKLLYEEPQTTPEGRTIWLRTSKVPLRNGGGEISGILGVYEDITERKQLADALRQREQYQRAVLDNFPFMVWLKDEESRYLAVNESFATVMGCPSTDSMVGKTDLDIAPAELAHSYRADDREVLLSGHSKQVEELVESKGRRAWFETWKSPISIGGRIFGTVGFSRDVTKRKEAEWNLKMAVEVTKILFWKLDLLDNALEFDQANLQALDMDPDDALSTLQGWLDHVHADDAPLFISQFQAAMQAGGPVFDLEYRLRRRDGQYQWIHTKGSVIQRCADGRPELAVGTSMNVTARKQVQAELESHRQRLEQLVEQRTTELLATEARATRILESAADGLYGVDRESRITFMNPAACRMLGYTPEQALGQSAHELFHHSRPDGRPYPASECAARQSWRAGRESRIDGETYWHADGHPVPVALASHPIIEKGEIVGAVVSVVDVSVQRAATLARERALVAAENLALARSEFLANMSHEIRTPMNGVLGFAHIGWRNCKDPDKVRSAFEKILTSGNQLLGVVNDILDFSKIDAGKLHVEQFEMSIGDVLDGAVQQVADRARAKGLGLRLDKSADLPPTCIGDPLRLGQILLNLLTNAIKFTKTGSVTLSATRDGEQLVFRVTDTGIGMSTEQLGYIFNPFQQADSSTTRHYGGTGLGLAICKRLLDLMQGEIRVESTGGIGSLFEVRLPYMQPEPNPEMSPADSVTLPDKPLSGISILLAEDDETSQKMLEIFLADDGARVVLVGDGAAALERVVSDGPNAYDIVLMDIQMPVMDGFEASRRILEIAPDLPIIGQTSHAFDEDRDKCVAAGMVGHIAKPIDQQALAKLVLQVLATKRPAA
jgi:PAS domain S-box-containing protein